MKRNYITLIIFCFCSTLLSAQSLEEAKKLFQNKEYEKAKPAFQRLVKSTPGNASYNYWYGACCYETGEKELSEQYLVVGAKRKVQEAYRYLGMLYFDLYRFDESIQNYEEYISLLRKAKKDTSVFEENLQKSKLGARMIKGVEDVAFIDSFVIDKDKFLEAYKISEESGEIYKYDSFFKENKQHDGTVYQNELKNKLYYADLDKDGELKLYSRIRQFDSWGNPVKLPASINAGENQNYPYVLSDGVTIYYGSEGENSLGGYDIFVTRYNTNTDNYMVPDNIGMPFNSPYNDYMFVIDEFNNLGWFVSDRYQPEDKVCVYVFIPNSSKQTYNYENTDQALIRKAAMIHSIESTWKNTADIRAAKQRLATAKYYRPEDKKEHDFTFIVDDNTTYHTLNDFTSQKAKSLFSDRQRKQSDLVKMEEKLQSERDKFTKANAAARKNLAPAILDMEKRTEEMEMEIKQLEVNIRNEENKNLHK